MGPVTTAHAAARHLSNSRKTYWSDSRRAANYKKQQGRIRAQEIDVAAFNKGHRNGLSGFHKFC